MKFTEQQIKNWQAYEKVRQNGSWNMWTSDAIKATGLSKDDYMFCLKNYADLRDAATKTKQKELNDNNTNA